MHSHPVCASSLPVFTERMESLWRAGRAPIPSQPFTPGEEYDDVVVGAGLTGLTTALMLAESGRRVAVLEARDVGAVATGNTTGKISLLQGTRLSTIRRHHSEAVTRAYVDANRDGQSWLLDFCERAGVAVQRHEAFSYAQTLDGVPAAEAEVKAAVEAGLDVRLVRSLELPFPAVAAAALPDQAQVDAMELLAALAAAFERAGGVLHTESRVTGVSASPRVEVRTSHGPVYGSTVTLATGTPILDRGLYFSKVRGSRSYGLSFAFDSPPDLPSGMFLSVDSPTRTVRTAPRADGMQLVTGGNDHPTGRVESEQALVDDLVQWTLEAFPSARLTHTWSAQDYESHNLIPFVGRLPRGRGRVYMATGYAKWGFTNAIWAAMRIAMEIRGDGVTAAPPGSWHRVLGSRLTVPADLGRGLLEGVSVGAAAVRGWADAERDAVPVPRPAEGVGVVARSGLEPVGVSTVDGRTCGVSAVCTHLGGVVEWNDAERTWDCPLHASRFAADGTVLEGPATRPLRRLR